MTPTLSQCASLCSFSFFFNDTATTEIYTLSLHDALPISDCRQFRRSPCTVQVPLTVLSDRSEEHTSELQSPPDLVCRLLLEKKTQCSRGADPRGCGSARRTWRWSGWRL